MPANLLMGGSHRAQHAESISVLSFDKRIKEHDRATPPSKKAMLSLRRQYRMHFEIAEICRTLSYPEGLEAADIDRTLQVYTSRLNGCWQDRVVDPGKAVVFVSTEEVATQKTKDNKGSTINLKEAEIIEDIVRVSPRFLRTCTLRV